jgi:hypothetical protein
MQFKKAKVSSTTEALLFASYTQSSVSFEVAVLAVISTSPHVTIEHILLRAAARALRPMLGHVGHRLQRSRPEVIR